MQLVDDGPSSGSTLYVDPFSSTHCPTTLDIKITLALPVSPPINAFNTLSTSASAIEVGAFSFESTATLFSSAAHVVTLKDCCGNCSFSFVACASESSGAASNSAPSQASQLVSPFSCVSTFVFFNCRARRFCFLLWSCGFSSSESSKVSQYSSQVLGSGSSHVVALPALPVLFFAFTFCLPTEASPTSASSALSSEGSNQCHTKVLPPLSCSQRISSGSGPQGSRV
mmetsp:Transcript_3973/g.8186  ORF Transcript_3973/g.8186 Transcript_3973/m.8186 type:complete len:227 (+) Transcript_3973:488-1168(+)